MKNQITPRRFWTAFFTVWTLVITGIFFTKGSSPGVIQVAKLINVFRDREEKIKALEMEIESLSKEKMDLEYDPYVQEMQVRAEIGFIKDGDVIVEFISNTGRKQDGSSPTESKRAILGSN